MHSNVFNSYGSEAQSALLNSFTRGWLTHEYFSKGKHDLVLPAWILGILGPDGTGKHGLAGQSVLNNTDLRDYIVLGSPDSEEEPVIDTRGGIIPTIGSYTLIFGTLINNRPFYSSEVGEIEIELNDEGYPIGTVYWKVEGDTMVFDAYADKDESGNESLSVEVVRGFSNHQLFVTLCPLDQDGITEIPKIEYNNRDFSVSIDGNPSIRISEEPIRVLSLSAFQGHAGRFIKDGELSSTVATCEAGLASWAAAFPVRANPIFTIILKGEFRENFPDVDDIEEKWEEVLDNLPEIKTSDESIDELLSASSIILRLLADTSKKIVTVGPSAQEETWLPALVFQTRALDRLGFSLDVVRPILDTISPSIDSNGILTENKQWDAQGAYVLAIAYHYYFTDDTNWLGEKFTGIKRIADWVIRQRKRTETDSEIEKSQILLGLLPKGIASWFDPLYWKEAYFYSHNFWSAGILEISAYLAEKLGKHGEVERFKAELEKYKQNLDDSITQITDKFEFLPAGPFHRDNSEMIFNLHAFYPLNLYLPSFQPLVNTLDWLYNNYVNQGGLLIDQHWNAYGTYFSMLLAQAYRYVDDNSKVIEILEFLKSNVTNKQGWAEGISPLTLKGAVGDSPNGYAAAEWINLISDLFSEEKFNGDIYLLKGMPINWLRKGISAKGLKHYEHNSISLEAKLEDNSLTLKWKYSGKLDKNRLILCTPQPVVDFPGGIEQISTYQVKLSKSEGEITLKLS